MLTSKGCLLLMVLMPAAVGAAPAVVSSPAPAPAPAPESAADTGASGSEPAEPAVFATVGDQVISVAEYAVALRDGLRKKFYHGKVPEGALEEFRREVGEQLIDRALQVSEARRQALQPDRAAVDKQLEAIEKRASQHPQWAAQRERMMPLIREKLEEDSRAARLQEQVRTLPEPDENVLRAYYNDHPERFTEPERFRVSAILLKVAPSSPSAVWQGASDEGEELVRKLRAGASFEELARMHSGDGSAERGGDMGYLHRGMLGDPAQQAVDAARVGDITDPIKLLEGIGIFRLDDRPQPKLMAFAQVRERVVALWLREESERVWQSFMERLRNSTVIHINEPSQFQSPTDDAAKM